MADRDNTSVREYDDAETEAEWKRFYRNIKSPRGKGRVRGSWGVYDAYKHIRRNKWYDIGRPVTEKEFYAIIRHVNDLYAEEIGKGTTMHLPQRMGKLELRKERKGVFFDKNGKMRITYPVDWKATLKLWFEDPEARA